MFPYEFEQNVLNFTKLSETEPNPDQTSKQLDISILIPQSNQEYDSALHELWSLCVWKISYIQNSLNI